MALLRDALKDELGIDPVGGKTKIKGSALAEADTDVNIIVTGTKVDIHKGDGNPADVCMKSIQSGGLKTEPYGHHLSSQLDNRTFKTVYAGTPVTDAGSNGTVYFPKVKPIEIRIITHGNAGDLSGPLQDGAAPEFVGDFTENFLLADGDSYSYNVVPQQAYFLRRIYYKVGTGVLVGIGDSIRAHAYRGTDELGVKIYDHTTYVTAENIGAFVAGAEFPAIITNQITNGIDYAQGEELHWVLSFKSVDPTHRAALVTSVGGASPWRAVDRQQEEHVALVPVSTIFAAPVITSPVEGATGVSLTPTINTMKGASKYGSFQSSTDVVTPSNTAENTLLTIPLSPDFLGSKGALVGTVLLLNAANTNLKTYRLKLGGTLLWEGIAPNAMNAAISFSIYAAGGPISQMTIASITGSEETIFNTAINLSVPINLTLTVQKAVASDSIIMQYYDMFLTNSDSDLVGEYDHGGTVVKVRRNSDQAIVYDNNKVSGLNDTLPTPLAGATNYSVQASHYNSLDVPVGRSPWVNFRTLMDIVINLSAGAVAGDLVELDIGESVNASVFDFHIGGDSGEFPPAAFDSGDFRFKDSANVDLLFKVQSVTGTAPNRTAKCYIETNAQVISNGKIKLIGIGAGAANVSQSANTWLNIASGGTVTYVGNDTIHTFTTNGTFQPSQPLTTRLLAIAGGGGGGGTDSAGGGAGEYFASTSFSISAIAHAITVGAGGTGGNGYSPSTRGFQGGDTLIGSLLQLNGGGGGGTHHINGPTVGMAGGSGGGASGEGGPFVGGASVLEGAGLGNAGGASVGNYLSGGGGGGAGSVGSTNNGTSGGNGGAGVLNDITGASIGYAGGGGGASRSILSGAGNAGAGDFGGGRGAATTGTPIAYVSHASGISSGTAMHGRVNSGGGGGAGAFSYVVASGTVNGGSGGSGIAVFRFPTFNKAVHTDKYLSLG